MESPVKVYVFSSDSITNIWAAVGAKCWAVSKREDDALMQGLKTKAKSMSIGSLGIFYCSALKGLTTPFLVYSAPDEVKIINDIWPQIGWVLPFSIHPLGTPRKFMPNEDVLAKLPTLKKTGKNNITHVLPIPATTVFSPAALTSEDWAVLLNYLAE